jgi:hypothetical protein
MAINGLGDCKSAEVSMVIVRANGTVEDLGVVSYFHKNPLKRAIFKIKQLLGVKTQQSIK